MEILVFDLPGVFPQTNRAINAALYQFDYVKKVTLGGHRVSIEVDTEEDVTPELQGAIQLAMMGFKRMLYISAPESFSDIKLDNDEVTSFAYRGTKLDIHVGGLSLQITAEQPIHVRHVEEEIPTHGAFTQKLQSILMEEYDIASNPGSEARKLVDTIAARFPELDMPAWLAAMEVPPDAK